MVHRTSLIQIACRSNELELWLTVQGYQVPGKGSGLPFQAGVNSHSTVAGITARARLAMARPTLLSKIVAEEELV